MKKLLVLSFCAVLCVALTSCEKENNGKYTPKKKIQKIYYDSSGEKVLDQVWNWKGKLLTSIDFYHNEGVWYSDIYSYDSKNRIVKITEDSEIVDFVYENNRIKTINYYWAGDLEESYNMIYDNNKLSKIEWTQYDIYCTKGGHERKLDPLARLVPQAGDVLEKELRKMHFQQKGVDKIIFELTWDGKNVSHILGYYEDDPEETMDASFTYDNKINPLKGWISFWFEEVIGVWDDSYYTYSSYGNVLTADYIYKEDGIELDRITTKYAYEYEGNYPVKVTATVDGDDSYFTHYYEY